MTLVMHSGARALLAEAAKMADDRQWSSAADVCAQAHTLAPDDKVIADKFGWYLSRAKRYREAIIVYRHLADAEPDWAQWAYMVGYQYYDQRQWPAAIDWFARALNLRPDYMAVLYRAGYAYLQLARRDQARKHFEHCIAEWHARQVNDQEKEAKYYSDASYQLGKMLLDEGQYRRAQWVLSEAIRYDTTDAFKYYSLGKALFKNDRPTEALTAFQRADQLKPRQDCIAAFTARTYLSLNDTIQAQAILDRVPIRRRSHYIWRAIGQLHMQQERPQEAILAFQQAVKGMGENHNYHFALAQAHEMAGNIQAAYKACGEAIRLRRELYGVDFPEAQSLLVVLEEHGATIDRIDKFLPPQPDGYIKAYNKDRGFGFIARTGQKDLFFHITAVANPQAIAPHATVTFTVDQTLKGDCAKAVYILDDTLQEHRLSA